jgi:hypothetical protein
MNKTQQEYELEWQQQTDKVANFLKQHGWTTYQLDCNDKTDQWDYRYPNGMSGGYCVESEMRALAYAAHDMTIKKIARLLGATLIISPYGGYALSYAGKQSQWQSFFNENGSSITDVANAIELFEEVSPSKTMGVDHG